MGLFLGKNVPLISKELLNPWRVASLGVGLVLLVLGSVYLPSDDWDVPLCFVMGLPAYVLAPWVVRQAVGLRWKWLILATFAFWLTVDGTYTLYWWLKGFPHLAEFRPANFFYCTPVFWIAGFFGMSISRAWSGDCRRLRRWSHFSLGCCRSGSFLSSW